MSDLLDQVIARPGWQAGNAIAFRVGADALRSFSAADSGLASGAVFTVEYVEAGDLFDMLFAGNSFAIPIGGAANDAEGGTVSLTFHRPARFAHFGASYTIESSPPLAEGTWQAVAPVQTSATPDFRPNWEQVTLTVARPDAGPQFFRLRIAVGAE